MIQILGLRDFVDKKTGEVKTYDSHFKNGWRAPSVAELFANLDEYLQKIPERERYNMFYTVASCEEKKGRVFQEQDIVPIDIDGIKRGTESEVVDCILNELQLPKDKVGIVHSGNGVHILIQLERAFTSAEYFKTHRVYYKALCGRINQALFNAFLDGSADPTCFSKARILRLPNTDNIKPNKTETRCQMIQPNIEPLINVDLVSLADLPKVDEGDHIHPNAAVRLPTPDPQAVQSDCSFLVRCRTEQSTITEPMWYAMMSIIGRLPNGRELVHEYSNQYAFYDHEQTQNKLDYALEAAGPRTCDNISTMHEGCLTCPHFNKIKSPIQLVSKDFIRTKETGFYDIKIKSGVPVKDKPNYNDLVKYFKQNQEYFTDNSSELTYVFNGKYWEEIPRLEIYKFAEDNFDPSPSRTMCQEFEAKIKRTSMRSADFKDTFGYLNFENGVLDLDTMELKNHSAEYGFTYIIPYEYRIDTDCPRFDQFMKEITEDNQELIDLLLEYMGYCISGTDPKLVQMCAILHGGGGNGKSVLLDVLRNLVGINNCSAVSMKNISKETGRFQLMYKAINISDETPNNAFLESSDFKALVSGDTLEVRRLYQNPVMWKCTTKLIFACNDLPMTNDFSNGLQRRLLIIPFNATFSHELGNLDPFVTDKLLDERSGILHKILTAFKTFKERKYTFNIPKIVIDTKEDYAYMGDSILQFSNEECGVQEGNRVTARLAYKTYVLWCNDVNIKPASFMSFGKQFKNRIVKLYPEVVDLRKSIGLSKERVFLNLTVNANSNF